MIEWKQTVRGVFFDIKLLLQPDVVYDSESNGRLKYFQFYYKMTSLVGVGVFFQFFGSNESLKKVLQFNLKYFFLITRWR